MLKTTKPRRSLRRKRLTGPHRRRKVFNRLLEHRLIKRVSFEEYRDKVRDVYDGPQGAMLATCSMLSGHTALGHRLFKKGKFELRGARQILDVGSGAGQIARHLLKYADPGAKLTCVDLSHEMLRRARNRLKHARPRFLAADMTRLPFADASFDCITCGYVLEHLPDAKPGLAELSRVMKPGARMLLLTTEDNFSGAMTSRMWRCRTYNRRELARLCDELGLVWHEELWFSRMHKVLRAGGICAVLVKQ
ncbi:MAG: class I SAM-dependent methyltransferase [Candidatus Nealsonbacteria bacterium]|nr:class I SAM-dependent methyltransferase [Candidatus Nealsonbacteria bacterium]